MKHSFKKLPNSQIELEVVLDQKEFVEYYQPIYDQALNSVHLKGFRPGAAPKEMASQAVNQEKVFEEAVNQIVREKLQELTKENDWKLIDQPKIEVIEDPKNPAGLKFKATLTVFPEINLGNYKKIAENVLKNQKPVVVSDQEAEDSLKWILNSRAKEVLADRPAQKGDVVEMEYIGLRDGKVVDQMSNENDKFILGEGKFIPGFEENIAGHKEGESVEFSVTFPKDYWEESLRDQKVDFKVTIKGVFARELPELTDEFAKSLGKFENVEDLKKSIRTGLQKEKEAKEKEKSQLKVLEEIRKSSAFDLPRIMVDKTMDNMAAEYQAMAGATKNKEEIRQHLQEAAEINVKDNLILYQIAKEERLDPTPEEVKAESDKFLARSQLNRKSAEKQIDLQRLYDYIYGIIQNRKVFEYLGSLK
ncbi:MAG: trigger factor [bacterium]|nr:trigger factor [bacterium]